MYIDNIELKERRSYTREHRQPNLKGSYWIGGENGELKIFSHSSPYLAYNTKTEQIIYRPGHYTKAIYLSVTPDQLDRAIYGVMS